MEDTKDVPVQSSSMRHIGGYFWALLGVGIATGVFWLVRAFLDKGQASLLYLPVVIACAIRFGFGPAVLGAVLSFLCWNYFFLPPFYTFVVNNPKDWISLFVFLLAALSTAQLASRGREQTQQAQVREAEIATLFQASESLSREVRADSLLPSLAQQLQASCRASRCLVFRSDPHGGLHLATSHSLDPLPSDDIMDMLGQMARVSYESRQVIGFGMSQALWTKALDVTRPSAAYTTPATLGVYVPLQAEKNLVGVLHIGPRLDGSPFSALDERLILTLANHAAVIIAREDLAEQAAQAAALREADALKDSLLSLVSHELRTPLAAIKASVTGLLDPRAVWDEPSYRESLLAVNRQTDRLSAVVDNLLDLSRLEAGAWQPHKDWCDLAEVVSTVLDRLPASEAIRVEVDTDADLPLIQGDYTQIALVLTNFLENAVKYTPANSPIRLGLLSARSGQEEAASGVIVRLRDFGEGLAPNEEEHLFERFYRSPRHQQGSIHGTGLGLALCQAIIRAHRGRIWAANAPADGPAGAVFSFFLPIGASNDTND